MFQAPIRVDMKIGFMLPDGTPGFATIGLDEGLYPTREVVDKWLADIGPHLPSGARLMTKREFWDFLCVEKTGQTFALPGREEWDAAP